MFLHFHPVPLCISLLYQRFLTTIPHPTIIPNKHILPDSRTQPAPSSRRRTQRKQWTINASYVVDIPDSVWNSSFFLHNPTPCCCCCGRSRLYSGKFDKGRANAGAARWQSHREKEQSAMGKGSGRDAQSYADCGSVFQISGSFSPDSRF